MKLSGPIFQLKRRAKRLKRTARIPLHEALDRVAAEEGFRNWSLLAARHAGGNPASELLASLQPGDLLLLGARPMQGKTRLAMGLLAQAHAAARAAFLFSLELAEREALDLLASVRLAPRDVVLDTSDAICADYIMARMRSAKAGDIAVIDYLQILDQQRTKAALVEQVRALKVFAQTRGLILVFISQIDRRYDAAVSAIPGVEDVRLPNALDLSLFTKTCFLREGEMVFGAAA